MTVPPCVRARLQESVVRSVASHGTPQARAHVRTVRLRHRRVERAAEEVLCMPPGHVLLQTVRPGQPPVALHRSARSVQLWGMEEKSAAATGRVDQEHCTLLLCCRHCAHGWFRCQRAHWSAHRAACKQEPLHLWWRHLSGSSSPQLPSWAVVAAVGGVAILLMLVSPPS